MNAQPVPHLPNHDAVPRVPGDIPCIGCAYNLRTLPLDSLCPECGRPVAGSLRKGVLIAPENTLKRIKRGAQILAILPIAFYLGFVFVLLLYGTPFRGSLFSNGSPDAWFLSSLMLLVCALAVYGSVLIAVRVPGYHEWPGFSRIAVRYGFLPVLGTSSLVILGNPLHARILLILAVTFGVWLMALSLFVRQIAALADDEALRAHASIVTWMNGVVAVVPVASWLVYVSGLQGVLGVAFVAAGVLLPAIVFIAAIMVALVMNGLAQLVEKSLDERAA